MKQYLSVMNSDAINRYGYRFSVGALTDGLQQEYAIGIPMLVAHDASRLIGWTRPLAIYFEPGLTRFVGLTEFAENREERQQLADLFVYSLQKRMETHRSELERLKALLADHLRGEEKIIEAECVALVEPDLAKRAFPELFAQQDKDGLIPASSLTSIGPGVFQVGDLTVFAHQFLRRNLYRLNTLNYQFLERFQSFADQGAPAKIAFDPDMVGLTSTYSGGRLELAYWWGPKFSDDLTSIPGGVTHHEADETERLFYGISGTQFRWGVGKGQHIFEAEELRNVPTASESTAKYGCRYVHAIVSEPRGAVVDHFDGSIRMYSEDAMLARLDVDLAHAGRNTEYTKLWRLDGAISTSQWKQLLSDYFRDNYTVGEYLGAPKEDLDEARTHRDETPLSLQEDYVPYFAKAGMGIRVALSYHSADSTDDAERSVRSLDRISFDGASPYIESEVLELKKVLMKLGTPLYIAEDVKLVSFRDHCVNLPSIIHKESILPQGLRETIDAIRTLVNALAERNPDWLVSYSIGFPVGPDKEAWISVFGHVADLGKWFSSPLSCPPATEDELRDWAEQVAKHLEGSFSATSDKPRIFEVLMPSGILLINRKRVEWGSFQVRYSEESQGHVYELVIPQDKVELAKALQAQGICPGVGVIVLNSRCTRCGASYRDCGCSKLLDENVVQEITEAVPFLFWTDRPYEQFKLGRQQYTET